MAEQVKVFKNVQSQAVAGVSHSDNMFTNAATTRSVVKQISATGLGVGATLEMGGSTIMTSTSAGVMEGSGNLIMDVNNALSLKFPDMGIQSLNGMFFANGSDGINKVDGDYLSTHAAGSQAAAMTVTNYSTGAKSTDDACATRDASSGAITFWRQYSGQLYSYKEDGTEANSAVSFGGNGYNICTDGVKYIYAIRAGSSSAIDRYNYVTKVVDTIATTSGNMYGPQGNQGAYGLYYKEGDNEYLLGKEYATSSEVYRLNLSTRAVNYYSHGAFSVGSYSDGAAITTNTAGTTYLVEQGTDYWTKWDLSAASISNAPIRVSNGSSSSTEYAQGAGEIAPGIVLVFGENSDRISLINVNVGAGQAHYSNTGSHGFSIHYDYSNRFAFATLPILAETRSYDVRISGVEITEDS